MAELFVSVGGSDADEFETEPSFAVEVTVAAPLSGGVAPFIGSFNLASSSLRVATRASRSET